MVASLPEALRKAMAEREAQNLSQVVGEWSADDTAHVDPPLQNQPSASKETTMHAAQESTPSNLPNGTMPPTMSEEKPQTTKATFDFIRDNPGLLRSEAVKRIADRGHKAASVSSLIGQMMLQRMIMVDADNRLYATVPEFKPLRSGAYRNALQALRRIELEKSDPVKAEGYRKMAATRKRRRLQRMRQAAAEAEAALNGDANAPEQDTVLAGQRDRAAGAREALAKKRAAAKRAAARAERVAAEPVQPKPRRGAAGRAVANARRSGVDIDAAHKHAMPVQDIVERQITGFSSARPVTADLRDMSADQIVQSLSIVQARGVYQKLAELLGG